MGRQPFVVAPNFQEDSSIMLFTAAGVSPEVGGGTILFSLITLGSLYGILAVVEIFLLTKFVRSGIPGAMPELVEPAVDDDEKSNNRDVLAFAY